MTTPDAVVSTTPLEDEPMLDVQDGGNSSNGSGVNGTADGEDRVVREIDVYLSPQLGSQIHLIQFPLQQTERALPIAARIKPRHHMMELDFEVGTDSSAGGSGAFHMNTRTFHSHTIPVSTHMVLGKLVPETATASSSSSLSGPAGLHLVPLSNISQMKPSFAHVDEASSNAGATTEAELKKSQQAAAAAANMERKPLAFTRKESERAALARKSSYAYKKASEEEELWQSLEVYVDHTAVNQVVCRRPNAALPTKGVKNKQVGENADETPSNHGYVRSLNYLPQQGIIGDGADGNSVFDAADGANNMEHICAKLVRLMKRGYPIPFTLLRNQFQPEVSDDILLTALENCAFFVRGNFILQSRLLPMPAPLVRARTFILLVLQTIGVLHRPRLAKAMADIAQDLNDEATAMLLLQVAKKTKKNGWALKVEDDIPFATQNITKLGKHIQFWRRQEKRFAEELRRYKED